ncbi:pyridoxine 5'-phosphate synthase [Rhodopila sp.]|jgi:pyridoxine 5-phosphate synthase|uniref:pyridoxine 5'-phosphate synthase n=1 Tax=Rhodopila sp. TaxID=2480087 RepID=UPI002C6E66B6|nr:pyridoxine 5'-phosphate synthase [Rhodopila sp.]HVZ08173.1 pyridoxine 5'-phosphate synthase [Rhodopila sp.]
MARLSVNLNKIALLRNSRHTGVPDVKRFGHLALEFGAQGLTIHPRPDERHIRASDVPMLAELLKPHRPAIEFNIEGYPDDRLFGLLQQVTPEQTTLVPDAPDAFTSDQGWQLDDRQMALVKPYIARVKALGGRVILFVDANPTVIPRVQASGADGIEIYTGPYAEAFRQGTHAPVLQAIAATGAAARQAGLMVNAGHDLNLHNLPPLCEALPHLHEASIGHELTADALERGFGAAVAAYVEALRD